MRCAFRSILTVALLLVGCATPPPPAPPPKVAEAPPPESDPDPGPGSVEGEIGGLNEEAMDRAFASLSVEDCLHQASSKLRVVGGEFKLKLRIDRKGEARWAYLSESTLGDREAERCVLDLVRAKSWPKPLGGEGIAEKSFALDSRAAPMQIDEKRLRRDLDLARNKVAKCRHGVEGSFFVTLYLRPDGRVASAGVAPPNENGEEVADCLIATIRSLRFRTAAPRTAKLTFQIP